MITPEGGISSKKEMNDFFAQQKSGRVNKVVGGVNCPI